MKTVANPERHSLIFVPEEFIVPGGRFREFYYWDAYWIVKGLIASDLLDAAKNMIINFISCVKRLEIYFCIVQNYGSQFSKNT